LKSGLGKQATGEGPGKKKWKWQKKRKAKQRSRVNKLENVPQRPTLPLMASS